MDSEFLVWYNSEYEEITSDSLGEDRDHQRACYSAWKAAKALYQK